MNSIIYFLLEIALFTTGEAYKALVVYPMPAKSHSILGDGIVRHLLNDGVEVTYVTPFGYKNPPTNLRLVDISANLKLMPSEVVDLKKFLDRQKVDVSTAFTIFSTFVPETLKNKHFEQILNDPNEHFDVVLVGWILTDSLAGLSTIYNCPLIWTYPADVNSQSISLIDTGLNPAFSGTILSTSVPPFNFYERARELVQRVFFKLLQIFYIDRADAELYEKYLVPLIKKRGREPPSYNEVRYNASLVLGNSHTSLGEALPLPQNYISVGGQHLDEVVKPLPKDLQKIMDNAKDGVIYFSMGSNLKSKDWPEDMKRDLLKMFGGLKQTVLWKFEEEMENTPTNVHILKWAPQQSILAHPNTVLFISHGGFLSTTETICYGVPVIGMPVFGDQPINVKRAVEKGFAVEVKLTYNLVNDLKAAIQEILSNPKYRQKVKELSYIYHDRPVKPGVEVSHWVRHVIETRGAPHLRSPSARMPLYQLLYLDLVALLVFSLFSSFIVLKKIILHFRPKNTNKQKKH